MKNALEAAAPDCVCAPHVDVPWIARAVLACAAALLVAALPRARVQAQAPAQIPIQGFLTSDAGVPVTGSHSYLFALYDGETGGSPIYTETQTVSIEAGFFTAYLGDESVLSLALFRDHGPVYLGVSIDGGSELSPRTTFATVPYAAYAEYAGHVVSGGAAAGSLDFTGSAPSNTPAMIKEFVVTAPGPGMLTVMMTANAFVECDSALATSRICPSARVGICTASASLSTADCGVAYPVWHEDPDNTLPTNEEHLITVVRTIPVAAAGAVTMYINGQGPEAGKQIGLTSGSINVIYTPGDALVIRAGRVGLPPPSGV